MAVDINVIYRDNYSKLVTSLISYFGFKEMSVAEDIVQDTFTSAVDLWPQKAPDDPKAWLFRVCKNKAINYIKKNSNLQSSRYEGDQIDISYKVDQLFLPHEIKDNKLRVMFALCHPELTERAQVVMILRFVVGFKIAEIASGLGINTEAAKKIVTRSKQVLQASGIPLRTPFIFKLAARRQAVHKALYLTFSEGYSASNGEDVIKQDLCQESFLLLKSMLDEDISDAEGHALMALMLFNLARVPARLAVNELESQDRSLWDRGLIKQGFYFLNRSRQTNVMMVFHIEAAIAALHCQAKSFDETDWCQILTQYELLYKMNKTPFVWLSRCIALSYCHDPSDAVRALSAKPEMNGYYLYYVTLGKLYTRLNQPTLALDNLKKGLALTKVGAQKKYIKTLINNLPHS